MAITFALQLRLLVNIREVVLQSDPAGKTALILFFVPLFLVTTDTTSSEYKMCFVCWSAAMLVYSKALQQKLHLESFFERAFREIARQGRTIDKMLCQPGSMDDEPVCAGVVSS